MMVKFINIWIVICVIALTSGLDFPSDIPRCKREDLACIVRVANLIVRTYPKGRPDLGVPQIDPYFLNQTVDLSPNGGGAIKLELKVRNTHVYGLSTQDFQRAVGFTKDPLQSKFELYGKIPKLELRGEYTANGRILAVPLQGTGKYILTLEDVDGAVKFKPTITNGKDGKSYIRIEKVKTRLSPKKIRIVFDNLFNGNKEIGESVNHLLNDNIKDVWDELSPRAFVAAQLIMGDVLDKIFSQFAYEDLYLD